MIGASARARTMARATARAYRSSPSVAITAARSRSRRDGDDVGRARRRTAPIRMSSGPSRRNEKPRPASSSCIDETPRSNTTPSTVSWPRPRATSSRLEKRSSTSVRRPAAALTRSAPECNRLLIAIDADHPAVRGSENGAGIAAGAECRIDVDGAVPWREKLDHGMAEHGNVTSQSASDSRGAVAARHHSRAPGGPSAALREPSCFLCARTFSVASASSARKRLGSQI